MTNTDLIDDLEDEEHLFAQISAGHHDGQVIADIGWAAFQFRDQLGIEPFVGLADFGDQAKFFKLVTEKVGTTLTDWEPITLTLYLCWFPHLEASYETESAFCYAGSRVEPDKDALSCRPMRAFALRHKARQLLTDGKERAFYCARERSFAEAEWRKRRPESEITPAIMTGRMPRGLYLTGTPAGGTWGVCLTWPSSDLEALIQTADELVKEGISGMCLCECGIGLELSELSDEERRRLIALDQSRGGNSLLVDLAEECGILAYRSRSKHVRKETDGLTGDEWHTAVTCPCCGAHLRYEVSALTNFHCSESEYDWLDGEEPRKMPAPANMCNEKEIQDARTVPTRRRCGGVEFLGSDA